MAQKISSNTFWRLLKIHSLIFPHTFPANVEAAFSTTNAQEESLSKRKKMGSLVINENP